MVYPLTFGVELEFNVVEMEGMIDDPHPEDPREAAKYVNNGRNELRHQVAKILTEVGLPATIDCTEFLPKLSSWFVTKDSSVFAPGDQEGQPLTKAYGPKNFQDIELNSPLLFFSEEALDSVRLACEAITKHLRTTNFRTSGLHVHIGNGGNSFTLGTMKKLLAFIWTFEDQINDLHYRQLSGYAGSIRDFSVLSFQIQSEDPLAHQAGKTTLLALKKIFKCDSMSALLELFSIEDNFEVTALLLSCRFHNLCEESYENDYFDGTSRVCTWDQVPKKTIEFRHGAGTLDPEWICMWIRAIMGFMEVALSDDNDDAVLKLLVGVAQRERDGKELPDIYDVFRSLGIKDCEQYFQKTRDLRAAVRKKGRGVMDDPFML